MKGKERREKIIEMLSKSSAPIAGKEFAEMFSVSRQVIVQDIALLRAEQFEIISTSSGYILISESKISRVYKVIHTDEQVEEEMNLIVDYGGCIEDVFVYHKIYGTVRGQLNIRNRKDVQDFMESLRSGKSSLLKNVTSGYHYHTVTGPSVAILDMIQEQLRQKGFLASLQDYEPINFWNAETTQ